MKNEIIEANEIIQENNFKRVDFNDPSSILNYGQDILNEIEQIVSKVTNEIDNNDSIDTTFYEKVDKLSGFGNKLDILEEKRDKQDKGFTGLFNKVFRKNVDTESLSYNTEYKNYVKNVDEIEESVQKMYESSKNDFELFNTFIKSIKPYVEILNEVYNVGQIDLHNFEIEVLNLEKLYTENSDNSDLKREAIYKRQVLDIFTEKLYSIQKSKLSINEIIIQWNMRQINAIKQLTSYQSFLSLDKSIIKLNGTALVGAKKQKEEVETLSYLIDGVNKALIEGPKELNTVISSVNELTKDGNIKKDTIMAVDSYLQTGVKLLKEGSIQKRQFIKSSQEQLELVSKHFKDFNIEIKEQILLDACNDDSSYKQLILR